MKVTYRGKKKTASNIYTFLFQPKTKVRYVAGQFIELKIPHDNPDERGDKHWFTLSSSPTDELLSITTKIIDRSSSFKRVLSQLKSGTELEMAAPMGDFVLPKDKSIPLLFVAGGIGCTPYHSIIKFLQDTNENRDIQLLYAANRLDEVAFRDTFDKLGDNFQIMLSDPPTGWDDMAGRLNAQTILKTAKNTDKRHIYLSGPEPMVETLSEDIKKAGFSAQRLHTDFFPGYTGI
jgi:ferredoxin-NADP reductase